MNPDARNLHQALDRIAQDGTLIKDRGYRQVWRVEHQGQAYFVKFYPRDRRRLQRLFRGSPAMREFSRLQWLQKASVPAPRASAVLMGLQLGGVKGDAVVMQAIEPAVSLDEWLNAHQLAAEELPDRHALRCQVLRLLQKLSDAGLRHRDLHLGNLLHHDGEVFLLDAYAVARGAMRAADLFQLGHSVALFGTLSDLLRGWRMFRPDSPMPRVNPVGRRWNRKLLERATADNRYFGAISVQGWRGFFFKRFKYPRRWAPASRLEVNRRDWEAAWPLLLDQIASDQLEVIKRSDSGDVLGGEVVLGGRPMQVIIKRPRRKLWVRYLTEIGRGVRARRAWSKAWNLVIHDIPTAWPLAMLERRRWGYVTDAIIVFERVTGTTLGEADLDVMPAAARQTLFFRTGRLLRRIERHGFKHWDAKSTNWMVRPDERRGPDPLLIDVDGIRRLVGQGEGIRRLLESMRDHPQYTPEDSLMLCRGYAPRARIDAGDSQSEPLEEDSAADEERA